MCKKLNITRMSYYKWINKSRPIMNNYNQEIATIISVEHYETNEVYGTIRLKHHIRIKYGIIMNHKMIRRYKNIFSLKTVVRLKRNLKFNIKKVKPIYMAHNLLQNNFTSEKPLQKLSTDVSYIKCTDGLLYLSVVKDLFDNQIITYQTSNRNNVNLIIDTIGGLPKSNGIIHSDQGSLYYSSEYRSKIKKLGYKRSMSRRGACWENSPIENWFSQLKEEHLRRIGRKSMKDTRKEIKKYIEWYNTQRIQKSLGYLPPCKYS